MRARYEDLLHVARRTAEDAARRHAGGDLAAGWASVVRAAEAHLAWLRGGLDVPQFDGGDGEPDVRLAAVARAIGAGADLLAAQDLTTAHAFAQLSELASARAEVAGIVLVAGAAATARIAKSPGDESMERLREHLAIAMPRLKKIAQSNRRYPNLGALGGLTSGAPSFELDGPSWIARASVRWQRAHEQTDASSLLTRDLRSTTAQVRTATGYAAYLVDSLSHLRGGVPKILLRRLKGSLRRADVAAQYTAHGWQRRLSDVGGQSAAPGEAAFNELLQALTETLRPEGRLVAADVLVSDSQAAKRLLDALDELVYSAHRVVELQQSATAILIMQGRLFAPRSVVAPRDEQYLTRYQVERKHVRNPWVRTDRPDCFVDLTTSLSEVSEELLASSRAARELTGAGDDLRPYGGKGVGPRPLPRTDGPLHRSQSVPVNDPVATPQSQLDLGR